MKAKVYFKDCMTGKYRTKTVEVKHNEPNEIVRKFIDVTRHSKFTYITHIRCGRYDYQWNGEALEAFPDLF